MARRQHITAALDKLRNSHPALSLQSFVNIPNSKGTVFRITASHGKTTAPITAGNYIDMCHQEFGDKLALLPGTLEYVGSYKTVDVVSGLLVANTISKPAQDLQGFKVVASNMFMDGEENIWKLIGEGDNRRLVQAIQEDLSKILESRLARTSNTVVASAGNYLGVTPERGDYALYFSLASLDYDYGYAIPVPSEDKVMIASRINGSIESVASEQIIDCVERSSLPDDKQDTKIVASMLGNNSKVTTNNMSGELAKVYLDYMRNLYADTPYFDKLEELISVRRNLADTDKPISTMVS